MFAPMPEPPYVAVIFTSQRTDQDGEGYATTAAAMESLAAQQPGYIGIESVHDRGGGGVTISYWSTEADAVDWKRVAEHLGAQRLGRDVWYSRYITRVATVQRQYDYTAD